MKRDLSNMQIPGTMADELHTIAERKGTMLSRLGFYVLGEFALSNGASKKFRDWFKHEKERREALDKHKKAKGAK